MTPLAARLARRWGVLDHPGGYKAHVAPVPLLGGLAVALATLAAMVAEFANGAALHLAGLGGLAAGVCGTLFVLPALYATLVRDPKSPTTAPEAIDAVASHSAEDESPAGEQAAEDDVQPLLEEPPVDPPTEPPPE